MAANYNKVRQFLEESFPELRGKITGSNYPPPPVYELLTKILAIIQSMTLAWIIMGGEKVMQFFKITVNPNTKEPKFYYWIQENGFNVAAFIFLILPQIVSRFW